MMKKIAGVLSFVFILYFFAGGAFAAVFPAKLAITYVKAPLNVPSIVEKELKLFEEDFPNVALSFPELTEGPKQTAALASDEVEIASCLGATSAILAASEGLDLRIVGIYSRAPKAFMIAVKDPDIKSVADLRGKKVAGPKGTILHQLLAAALASEKMSANDVEFISMDLSSAASALANGSVQAALLAGPAAYNALASGGARMLRNGEGLIDVTIVIATTDNFMMKYPKAIEQFLKTHRKALDWIAANPDQAMEMTQKATGLPKLGVEAMFPWYDFDPAIRKSDIDELRRTQAFMLENGLQRKKIDINSIIAR